MRDYIDQFTLLSISMNGKVGRVLILEKAGPTFSNFNAIMPVKITIKGIMVNQCSLMKILFAYLLCKSSKEAFVVWVKGPSSDVAQK